MNGASGFRFGDFEADVAEGVLRRGGFRVRLQELPFRLLVALGDSAGHPRVIETVPRRGYRFCARLERIPAIAPPGDPPSPGVGTAVSDRGGARRLRLASAVALALAVSAAAWRVPTSVEGEEPTGVAVLPFIDLSGADQALCDGLMEDAITSLARGSLSVIGRTSAMAYRAGGKRVDEIGRELGVPYVVEGSVRRGAGTVRVTVRLLAARTQTPMWSASFDGDAADPLALQARVAREIAEAVRARVAR